MFSFLRKLSQSFAKPKNGYIKIIYPLEGDPIVVHDSLSESVIDSPIEIITEKSEEYYFLDDYLVDDEFSDISAIQSQELCEEDDCFLALFPEADLLDESYTVRSHFEDGIFEFQSGISELSDFSCDINPATGLPMMDSCFDVAGNIWVRLMNRYLITLV